MDTARDRIIAAGLDPATFVIKAGAPQPDAERPALLSGVVMGNVFAVIRAWKQDDDTPHPYAHEGWIAVATVSKNPQLVLGELSPEEAERLRAQKLTPSGYEAPVGQEAVIGRSDPKPYTPPVQPIETTALEITEELEEELSDIEPVSLDCGPECVRLKGPEGDQDFHGPNCEHGKAVEA